MQVTTSWEEKGIEKGQRSIVYLLLEKKAGQLPTDFSNLISSLAPERLSALVIALLNFSSLA
jgi:Domain of unknown function (DUF4351)